MKVLVLSQLTERCIFPFAIRKKLDRHRDLLPDLALFSRNRSMVSAHTEVTAQKDMRDELVLQNRVLLKIPTTFHFLDICTCKTPTPSISAPFLYAWCCSLLVAGQRCSCLCPDTHSCPSVPWNLQLSRRQNDLETVIHGNSKAVLCVAQTRQK